jgi:putative ABC transport system permease protein
VRTFASFYLQEAIAAPLLLMRTTAIMGSLGLSLALAGVLTGGALSVAFGRLLTAGTAGIGAPNPIVYVIVPIALIGLTMLASYFPARRAACIDPLLALRCE